MMLRALKTVAAALLLAATAIAQEPFDPVPGTQMIDTPDFGKMPREIVWKRDGQRMILIPGGPSRIGRPAGTGVPGNESPERTVTLPSFYIDKFEVSVAQYMQYAKARGGNQPDMPQRFSDEKFPVTGIPHASAAEYARWSLKELPSEVMWEKAARGTDGALYIGGTPSPDGIAIGRQASGTPDPASTEGRDVSPYGVANMAGNVREWLADWFVREAYAQLDEKSPKPPADGVNRVVRGASFSDPGNEQFLRLTRRDSVVPNQTREDVGLRTVFVLRAAEATTPTPTPTPTPAPFDPQEELRKSMKAVGEALAAGSNDPVRRLTETPQSSEISWIGNFSPYYLRGAFVTRTGVVAGYPLMLKPGEFATVSVPSFGSDRVHLAVAPYATEDGKPLGEVQSLGEIAGARDMAAIIPAAFFITANDIATGQPLPKPERVQMLQYYDRTYNPQWDEVDLFLAASHPMQVRIVAKGAGPVASYVAQPNSFFTGKLKAGEYEVIVTYVGSQEPAAPTYTFAVSDSVARNQIRVTEDTTRTDRIRVLAKRLPYLSISNATAVGSFLKKN